MIGEEVGLKKIMGEIFWRKTPAESPDQGPEVVAEASSNESSRLESVESAVTVDSGRCESSRDVDATLEEPTVWTNEKHNTYLDYLETSFLEQLNHSINIRRWLAEGKIWGPFSFHEPSPNCHIPIDQPTLVDRPQSKNNLKRKGSLCERDASPVRMNQWISHFTSSSMHHPIRSTDQNSLVGTGEGFCSGDKALFNVWKPELKTQNQSHCGGSVGSTAEASDQNFADEAEEEKLTCAPSSKRPRTTITPMASESDQAVPFGMPQHSDMSRVRQTFRKEIPRTSPVEELISIIS